MIPIPPIPPEVSLITLDMIEQKKWEARLSLFKESMGYILNKYKSLKLPVTVFTTEQAEYLKSKYRVSRTEDKRFYIISKVEK